eukprot:TRINITY_DN9550_c0_g1_i1.p2 TRINITY_DN9550_c0_g1~~TRINITY_DN9550_c0_g1_i1.p2  ORF type:complete len:191 (-),score=-15.95 TRINITY_DN9550_c0_g1_i1:126-698(-)
MTPICFKIKNTQHSTRLPDYSETYNWQKVQFFQTNDNFFICPKLEYWLNFKAGRLQGVAFNEICPYIFIDEMQQRIFCANKQYSLFYRHQKLVHFLDVQSYWLLYWVHFYSIVSANCLCVCSVSSYFVCMECCNLTEHYIFFLLNACCLHCKCDILGRPCDALVFCYFYLQNIDMVIQSGYLWELWCPMF